MLLVRAFTSLLSKFVCVVRNDEWCWRVEALRLTLQQGSGELGSHCVSQLTNTISSISHNTLLLSHVPSSLHSSSSYASSSSCQVPKEKVFVFFVKVSNFVSLCVFIIWQCHDHILHAYPELDHSPSFKT